MLNSCMAIGARGRKFISRKQKVDNEAGLLLFSTPGLNQLVNGAMNGDKS